MSLRVTVASKVKYLRYEAVAKASLNRANTQNLFQGQLVVVDAKPSDLPMGRLKLW